MTRWEIRLHDQPPMYVEVDDDARDLAAEFETHMAKRKRRAVDHWWRPVTGAGVQAQVVIGVRRRGRVRDVKVAGFQ